MDYGVVMFPTEYSVAPHELARTLDERGFESVWFAEHTHIPASRESPWPGGPDLPRDYWSSYDLFVAMAAAAVASTRIKIGSGICLVIERDPIITAKEIATLDQLSGGRILFGIGGGWNAEEMANHGTAWSTRWRLLRERILAMKAIWSDREATFHGEFVNFDRIWCDPKPVQQPNPPIIIGGNGPRTFDRVVEYGDGWMPILRPGHDPMARIPELHAKLREAGRAPESAPVSIFFAPPDRAKLDALEAAGVTRAIFGLPSADREVILPRLDAFAKVMTI